ncbi:MAG: tRNA (guanosine(37)-N1)-methyltransferase TrmD [Candidatus Omnitrophica bacterium]|nr:tRNA (guanosine(37)-N1)-methyltransferase TrmD [Candidatus Omnitrophota bacterium]MCA9430664.1 tRNA (guanosine(37)-N1)-methyltransferase TrmD [Candidatus Omnitrophota bacterium]MCB9783071.1 tRNA (guanosine(37)-N1)-methyltransferase TrmD [Candidatus Omnitrophota bacterium]
MLIDFVTVFPEMFSPLDLSIIGKAKEKGLVRFRFFNPRDYTDDPHRKVDDTQFGGSEGMVMAAPPLIDATEDALKTGEGERQKLLLTSPQGQPFTQDRAKEWMELDHLVIVCGHYKGIDERFIDLMQPEEVSIGDFVLTGGEVPAMAIADSIVRLLPDVVGGYASVEEDSFYDGLLDCPRYTRPRDVRGLEPPSVLLGGNHAKIDAWRKRMALDATRRKRPDLLEKRGPGL